MRSKTASLFFKCTFWIISLVIGYPNVHASEPNLNVTEYWFRSLTIDNGLPHPDANVVVQDKAGFIWVGTYSGLSCYDGYTLTTYYNKSNSINNAYINRIFDISVDENGLLWIATSAGIQLFDPVKRSFIPVSVQNNQITEGEYELEKVLAIKGNHLLVKTNTNRLMMYKVHPDLKLTPLEFNLNAQCHSLFRDKEGRAWIGTNRGCFILNGQDSMAQINLPETIKQKEGESIYFAFLDSEQRLWIATRQHLYIYPQLNFLKRNLNKKGYVHELEQLHQLPIDFSKGVMTSIVEDSRHRYWVSSTKGLFHLQKSGASFSCEMLSVGMRNNNLTSDFIIRLFVDRSDNLFVSTYAGGVNILDLHQKSFHQIQYEPNTKNSVSEKIIRAVADDQRYLWIGTNSMGLDRLDKQTGTFTSFRHESSGGGIGGNEIRALLNDKNGLLWIGHTHGLDVLDIKSGQSNAFRHINLMTEFPQGEVTSLAKDCFGQIWVGTWNAGICRIRKNSNGTFQTTVYKEAKPAMTAFSPSRVIALYADSKRPEVFYSSGKQLVRLFLDKKGEVTGSYVYQANEHNPRSLNSNFICAIRRENDSILWIGTLGGSLNRMTLRKHGDYVAQNFNESEGLDLKDIECLEIDGLGNIWAGGNDLVKYNPKTGVFQSYQLTNGRTINGYKIGGSCIGDDGSIYMAGIRGIVCFNPKEIRDNRIDASPHVASIVANNQVINFSDKIELTYDQNNFKICLTALHYANPQKCRFQYRLLNYNSKWQSVPVNSNAVYYANLPYKKYVLEVRATNNDGRWSPTVYSIPIEIFPPWWLSLPAKGLYLILGLLMAYFVYVYLLRWINLKKKLDIKELQEQHDRHIKDIQFQFFTNISHEFRNPLTLILGTVEKMNQDHVLKDSDGDVLMRNVKRLMGLVDDVLDFKKIETENPVLKVQEIDIHAFLRKLTDDFSNLSVVKHKKLKIEIPTDSRKVWIDAEILTKILMNLMNNAFKYTREHDTIEIKVLSSGDSYSPAYKHHYQILNDYQSANYLCLYVRDTGIGISKESIEDIFTRYYQIHDSELDPHLGSGIGLALVKSLILAHKGSLMVSSERKQGTDFYISIPCDISDYAEKEHMEKNSEFLNQEEAVDEQEEAREIDDRYSKTESNGKPLLLLVEDDHEVRNFFASFLQKNYRLIQAVDGTDAINKIEVETPDLIISDLMMPNMDGNVLCRTLKGSTDYNQIPFILLTAKKSQEAQIDGINAGADAYLNKPVSLQLLDSAVRNLLDSHKRLKEYVSVNYLSSTIEETLQNKDKEFYNQLIGLIDEHLSDSDLNVQFLSEKMGYSRTRFYQKVNQITGLPIKELVRLIRLRKAVQLMAEEDLSISEILLRIGIQSQSYFTIIFKKEYGKTPTAFIKEMKKNTI